MSKNQFPSFAAGRRSLPGQNGRGSKSFQTIIHLFLQNGSSFLVICEKLNRFFPAPPVFPSYGRLGKRIISASLPNVHCRIGTKISGNRVSAFSELELFPSYAQSPDRDGMIFTNAGRTAGEIPAFRRRPEPGRCAPERRPPGKKRTPGFGSVRRLFHPGLSDLLFSGRNAGRIPDGLVPSVRI